MPLISIDALPRGQVIINTDQIIQARETDGGIVISLADDNEVRVPHGTVADLFEDLIEGIQNAQSGYNTGHSDALD
ncbi:hypothetical protein SAMN03159338_0537 [Sphingomonas sp. NFR04]|uniref:hypothetical protein n=1 Tax=Sphingomonas sp. NFR04 TaxID=1566283 RepID=UPI0008E299ED|nr:hypothetical protein [Sphingomonas sp. NFR04]SFJ00307.1 hypothetical protein SAMN03159338_0537 [Sphingomonas sp. NFR04]